MAVTVQEQRPGGSLRRRVVFALLAFTGSLVVGLLATEALMRALSVRPERYRQKENYVLLDGEYRNLGYTGSGWIKRPSTLAGQAEVLMGEYVPGAVYKTVYDSDPRGYFGPGNSIEMRINSLGLRGPEVSRVKPLGVCRILAVGDSFTFGPGVREEHTFVRRLEQALNQQPAGQKRFEVINAGVEGYNTRDEVLYLEQRWLDLEPDVVVVIFYLNDAYSEAAIANEGQDLGVNLEQPEGLAQISYAWDYAQHAVRRYLASHRIQKFYMEHYFTHPEEHLTKPGKYQLDWNDSRQALARAAELTRQRKVKLALVMFPELFRLDEHYPFNAVHQLVMKTCGQLGIPALDLLESFRGHKDKQLWVHPSDHHPNETAHAMAAKALEKFLREKVLP